MYAVINSIVFFRNDSDAKCIEDWERVRVSDGNVVKVHLQVNHNDCLHYKMQNTYVKCL